MTADHATLEVKVLPNAPRDALAGTAQGVLKVRIHAPALDGRANAALCEFIAATLGVHRRAVTLLRGEKSRLKALRIEGLSPDELADRLRSAGA